MNGAAITFTRAQCKKLILLSSRRVWGWVVAELGYIG